MENTLLSSDRGNRYLPALYWYRSPSAGPQDTRLHLEAISTWDRRQALLGVQHLAILRRDSASTGRAGSRRGHRPCSSGDEVAVSGHVRCCSARRQVGTVAGTLLPRGARAHVASARPGFPTRPRAWPCRRTSQDHGAPNGTPKSENLIESVRTRWTFRGYTEFPHPRVNSNYGCRYCRALSGRIPIGYLADQLHTKRLRVEPFDTLV